MNYLYFETYKDINALCATISTFMGDCSKHFFSVGHPSYILREFRTSLLKNVIYLCEFRKFVVLYVNISDGKNYAKEKRYIK